MIQLENGVSFYEETESIEIPQSFKHLMESPDGYVQIWGKGKRGRKLTWVSYEGRWGWKVESVEIELTDDCCLA